MAYSAEFIAQVKRKLNITWSDADTDARVSDIMANAQSAVSDKIGVAADYDFSAAGRENELYLNYCLYAWNHVENEFDAAYLHEILQCRMIHEVVQNDTNGDV